MSRGWTGVLAIAFMLVASTTTRANPARTPAPPDAVAYIIAPSHGEVVHTPATVKFGLRGMGVAPAGAAIPGTGHHHLLIDVDDLPAVDRPIPSDSHHRHFGSGQTETTLSLPPGEYRLRLMLGDTNHVPHDPPVVSREITIRVD